MSSNSFIYIFLLDSDKNLLCLLPITFNLSVFDVIQVLQNKRPEEFPKGKEFHLFLKEKQLNSKMTLIEQKVTPYCELTVKFLEEQWIDFTFRKGGGEKNERLLTEPKANKNNISNLETLHNLIEESMYIPEEDALNSSPHKSVFGRAAGTLTKINQERGENENSKEIENGNIEDEEITMFDSARDIELLIKVQALFRMKKSLNSYQQKRKKYIIQRRFIIEELIKTEKDYYISLQKVVDHVIKPIKENNILTKEQISIIFGNIETIIGISMKFYDAISKQYSNKFTMLNSKFADIVVKMQPFFKLYFAYCNNYAEANEYLTVLLSDKKNNSSFIDFLQKVEFSIELEKKDLSSMLIKPIQRLPKYVLLFKELRKSTQESHPDYKEITKALENFDALNQENNRKMMEDLNKLKIFELQEKFEKSLGFPLLDGKRRFLEEEPLVVLNDNKADLSVIAFFFTDLIIVAEKPMIGDLKLITFLTLDYNSYVRDLPDSKYFDHIFTIFGRERGLTFMCGSAEHKKKLIKLLDSKIEDFRGTKEKKKKSILFTELQNKSIRVEVIGTVKRGLQKLKPYTVYITNVSCGEVSYKLFSRYKELLQLQEIMRNEFELQLRLPPKHFWSDQKSKTIESRKFHIEDFLKSVLQCEKIYYNGQKVLDFLGLPPDFYQKDKVPEKYREETLKWILSDKNEHTYEKLQRSLSVLKILRETLKSDHNPFSLMSMGISNIDITKERIESVNISLMNGTNFTIIITKLTKAFDVSREIAKKIGLVSWLDFKLFLVNERGDEKMVDDQEFMFKVLHIDVENKNGALTGFFGKIKNGFQSVLSYLNLFIKYQLVFKKSIYFEGSIEEKDYKHDLVKCDLLVSQWKDELFSSKHLISLNDYSLFAAFFAYLEYGQIFDIPSNQFINLVETKILNDTVPGLILLNEGVEYWIKNICYNWMIFSTKINETIKANEKFNEKMALRLLKKSPKTGDRSKPTDPKTIAKFVILNCSQRTYLHGTRVFFVTQRKLKNSFKEIASMLWFAIKIDNIRILEHHTKKLLLKLYYEEINNFVCLPSALEIELISKDTYRFYSPHAFEIYQMYLLYKKVRGTIEKLKTTISQQPVKKKQLNRSLHV